MYEKNKCRTLCCKNKTPDVRNRNVLSAERRRWIRREKKKKGRGSSVMMVFSRVYVSKFSMYNVSEFQPSLPSDIG